MVARKNRPTPFRFTEPGVRKIAPPSHGYVIAWDTKTPGLGLRVTANGARAYVFERRVHGETVRTTIGDPSAWKLEAARVEARRLTVLVDRKIDPRAEAAEKRAEAEASRIETQRRGLVLEGVWRAYIEVNRGKWSDRYRTDHIKLAQSGGVKRKRGRGHTKPGPLASLMPLKLEELTAETIAHWMKREAARRPTSAALSFRVLRAFVRWAAEMPDYRDVIPSDACTARTVRSHVPRPRVKEGDCLQVEQLPAWFKAVRALPSPIVSAYLQTLLLAGQRREVLAALRWNDVDFTWGSLKLRTGARSSNKGGAERTIPLTPYVASLLNVLPRINEFVFSSATAKGGRLVAPTRFHDAALATAGLPHVTLHGLRRSFGTLAEWVEMPTGVVAQIQGHAPSAIAEKHYRRRPLDLLRLWHSKFEAWILEKSAVPFTPPQGVGRLGVVGADGSVQPAA